MILWICCGIFIISLISNVYNYELVHPYIQISESKGLFWGRNVGEMGSIIPGSRGRMVSGC